MTDPHDNMLLTPEKLKTMDSEEILTEIIFLWKAGSVWNEDRDFKYLVLKDALRDAFLREAKEAEHDQG